MADENSIGSENNLAQFYANKNVLLTGATGYLGKLIFQKLLRSCPDIKGIYLVIRQKKGMDAEERLDKILENTIFDALRKEIPDFHKKLHVIPGDLQYEGIGLSTVNRKTLIEEVNIVLHSAASVTFNQTLRDAVHTNVRGTRELLDLCEEMKSLAVVMIMSTAYSFCPLKKIGEFFIEPPIKPDTIIKLVEDLDVDTLELLTPTLVGKWPNTYTYTKAIMEDIVRSRRGRLPIGMYRPSVVLPTYQDPIPGWVDNINGTIGMSVGSGIGVIHVINADKNCIGDVVPGDYCINGFIAATYDIYQKYQKEKLPEKIIYNYVATTQYSRTCGDFISNTSLHYEPYSKALWVLSVYITNCPVVYYLLAVLLHFIPALILDGFSLLIGKKPRLLKIYMQIERSRHLFRYFLTNEWIMLNDNVLQLWDKTSVVDKKLFPFHVPSIDWQQYYKIYSIGLSTHILKDKMDKESREIANKRYAKLMFLHKSIIYFIYLIPLFVLWTLFIMLYM